MVDAADLEERERDHLCPELVQNRVKSSDIGNRHHTICEKNIFDKICFTEEMKDSFWGLFRGNLIYFEN